MISISGLIVAIPNVAEILAIFSLPLAVVILFTGCRLRTKGMRVNTPQPALLMSYLAIFLIGIATSSLALVLFADSLFDYSLYLFTTLSLASPLLMTTVIFSLPLKIIMNEAFNQSRILGKTKKYFTRAPERLGSDYPGKGVVAIAFLILIISSFTIAAIPHLVKDQSQAIGVDTVLIYDDWINELSKQANRTAVDTLREVFVEINGGDRPLSLLIILGFVKLFPDTLSFPIDFLPLVLSPLLSISMFYLTREYIGNFSAAFLSAFITSVGFHPLIGMYGGFFSNWIALIPAYWSIILLKRTLDKFSYRNLLLFFLLLVVVLLTHIYTWIFFVVISAIFLAVMYIKRYYAKRPILLLGMVLLTIIAIDASKTVLLQTSSGLERDLNVADEISGLNQFEQRWNTLTRAVNFHLGGFFGNVIILGLSLYAILISKMSHVSIIMLFIFLTIATIPLFIGDIYMLSRVIYNIPLEMAAGLGLVYIFRNRPFLRLVIFAICFWLFAIGLYSSFNLINLI